jgi:hypothetical protein
MDNRDVSSAVFLAKKAVQQAKCNLAEALRVLAEAQAVSERSAKLLLPATIPPAQNKPD